MAEQITAPGILGNIVTPADHKAIVILAIISLVILCILVFAFIGCCLWVWWNERRSKGDEQARQVEKHSAKNNSGKSFKRHRQNIYGFLRQPNKQSLADVQMAQLERCVLKNQILDLEEI